jgi:mannitol/fructose-specific phosphotransferase system IIA component (Ntr-type)
MKCLLDALQEGRLVELPESEKNEALEYLAHMIEAIPDINSQTDLYTEVLEREKSSNTAIGSGIACPHVRSRQAGELLCAVGWSPTGIDYGAADGKKVHLVIMYYIPDAQRNTYLKEISSLAKAVMEDDEIQKFPEIEDIQSVRNLLLDWVELVGDRTAPDAKARMIKLEARQTAAEIHETETRAKAVLPAERFTAIPFSAIVHENGCLVLSPQQELQDHLENGGNLVELLGAHTVFEFAGYQVSVLASVPFARGRVRYDCVGIRPV